MEEFIAANEQDFISFKTELLLSEAGNDPLRKAELINDIADTIALIPDAVKRQVYAQASAERFGIESDILFARIRKTHEKLLQDDRKAAEEARRRAEMQRAPGQGGAAGSLEPDIAGPPPAEDGYAGYAKAEPAAKASGPALEEPTLAPSEKELLSFLLRNGRTILEFEVDSPFYCTGEKDTVADFIRDAIEQDDLFFGNSLHKRLLDKYFELYDAPENLPQEGIVKTILDGPDREMAALAAELLSERHNLTVKRFEAALTAAPTQLVIYVPRAIQVYQLRHIELKLSQLSRELKDAGEDNSMAILSEIKSHLNLKNQLEKLLGRVR